MEKLTQLAEDTINVLRVMYSLNHITYTVIDDKTVIFHCTSIMFGHIQLISNIFNTTRIGISNNDNLLAITVYL